MSSLHSISLVCHEDSGENITCFPNVFEILTYSSLLCLARAWSLQTLFPRLLGNWFSVVVSH